MSETNTDFPAAVAAAIWRALSSDDKTREPMNALLIWTELGRGLAGTLERKGLDLGALRRIIEAHCHHPGAHAPVDLTRWVYIVEPERRLSKEDIGQRLRAVEREIERSIGELMHESTGGEGQRLLFLTIVKGWFPIGVQIFRALPAGRGASDVSTLAALGAWCARYLPEDPTTPRDLGIRVEHR